MNTSSSNKNLPVKRSSACYFCNELFDDLNLQTHVNQCSQVLDRCPYHCGVYVRRRDYAKHAEECPRRRNNRASTGSLISLPESSIPSMNSTIQFRHKPPIRPQVDHVINFLETEIVALRSALTEERNYRLQYQIELNRLSKLIKNSDEQNKRTEASLDSLKKNYLDIGQVNQSITYRNQNELDKLHHKYQLIEEWKKQFQMSLETLRNHLIVEINKRHDSELTVKSLEQNLSTAEKIQEEFNRFQKSMKQEADFRKSELSRLNSDFEDFKEYLSKENIMISGIWNEQLEEINKFKKDIVDIDNDIKELSIKHHAIIFEVRSNTQGVNESLEKIDLNMKEIDLLTKSLAQLRQDFNDLETSVKKNSIPENVPINYYGHIIWKITDYAAKLKNSKDNDTIIRSPVFHNKPYGYTLRLETHLNGIGKWKGRHMIVTLQVLKGEWDAILDWPCYLPATIALKDQASKNEAKDLIKTLTAKKKIKDLQKEELEENSGQHIFIPHSTLEKCKFIKDDTMFIEVIVNDGSSRKSCLI